MTDQPMHQDVDPTPEPEPKKMNLGDWKVPPGKTPVAQLADLLMHNLVTTDSLGGAVSAKYDNVKIKLSIELIPLETGDPPDDSTTTETSVQPQPETPVED